MQSNSRNPLRMLAQRARASRLQDNDRDGGIVGEFLQGQRDCKDGVDQSNSKKVESNER